MLSTFSKKRKMSTEDFCQEFYDSYIFETVIDGMDMGSVWWEGVHQSVTSEDPSFGEIDQATFRREMMSLHLELFSLAWAHYFKREKYTLRQMVFTKRYLEQNSRQEFWESLLPYNVAIGECSTDIATGERARRAIAVGTNSMKINLFSKWVDIGVDPECAARVANRIGSEISWSKGVSCRKLADALLERLDCEVNLGGRLALRAVISGLYNGAKESQKSVKIEV